MALEDIILRTVANPPLVTKGSELTWIEHDTNFIELYNSAVAQFQTSYMGAYDPGTTYDFLVVKYAYYNSALYKWIDVIPGVGVTPGTDLSKWEKVPVAEMGHRKNYDTNLAPDHCLDYLIIRDNGSPSHRWKFTVDSTGMLSQPGEDLGE